ncbi:hypothetical protein ABPG72_001655 [Tetrahymena utriculariae]
MSKPVNFLDLIKNPDKIQNKQPIKGSVSNTTTPKEAVIPPNLAGAQKNEWLEQQQQQQKKNQQNAKKNEDDVQILDYNPFKNNQEVKDSQKKQIQKQSIQQAPPPKSINEGNRINNEYQIISKPSQQQQVNPPQQPINRNNVVNLGGDQLVFRQTQNNNQDKNANSSTEISKKNSIQFNSGSSNSTKNNILNQNNKANQQIPSNSNAQNASNKIISNNQRVQSNKSVGSIFSSNKSNTSNKSAGMSKQEMLKAKYSLINQSKEDYKKIFSKIVKEYSDTENKNYDPSKINYRVLFIYFCIFVFFIMISLDYIASSTPKFCKNEVKYDTPKCKVCPENAQCKNYVMKCNDGFIQESYKCKLNPNIVSSSESFIIEKITQIQYDNGYRMCFAQENEFDQKQKEEEEEQIKISRAQLLEELQQRLADKKAVAQQKKILEKFLVSVENQEKLGFKYDQETQTLTSSRLRFTIFCKCKQLIKNNQKSIAISSLSLVSLMIVGIILKKHFKKIRIANEIYEELVHQIQETSEKQINVSYYKEGIVNRFKSDFNEDVWVLVDRKRLQEQKINVYRDCDGLYWSQI